MASSTLVLKKSLTSRASPAGRPHRPTDFNRAFLRCLRSTAYRIGARAGRADERTRTAHLLITSDNWCVARVCECLIGKRFSIPCLARRPASYAVSPVILEPVKSRFPLGQPGIFGEACQWCVTAVESAAPVGPTLRVLTAVRHGGRNGQDLRPARRTPVNPVGEAPHLRVATLASMTTKGVEQSGYLAKRVEKRLAEDDPARLATGRVVTEGAKFVHLTHRTTQRTVLGGYRLFHLATTPYHSLCCVPLTRIVDYYPS
jgi:hypothetical protein